MKATAAISFLLLVILFTTEQVTAQYKFDKPVHLNREMGLPSNSIRCIAKGEGGFVWIGTIDGLCRFDGLEIRIYKPEPGNPRSLNARVINAVLAEQNRIWVATNQGLSLLDVSTDTFRHYQFTKNGKAGEVKIREGMEVTTLIKDKSGDTWIGTRQFGLCRYNATTDDFIFYRYEAADTNKNFIIPSGYNHILSIAGSGKNDSITWAGTNSGLLEVNKYTGTVKNYFYPQADKEYETSLNAFRRIYRHDDGLLYAGSWKAGVNVFDPDAKTFTPLMPPNEVPDMLRPGVSGISGIKRKDAQHIWFTGTLGLVEYNTVTKKITLTKRNNIEKGIFFGAEFIDDRNRVWTLNINGVQIFDPLLQQFRYASFENLFMKGRWGFCFYMQYDTATNSIIVCPRITDGLYIYNRTQEQWKKLPFQPGAGVPARQFITVRGFARQDKDRFTISADEGLFSFSATTNKLSLFPFQPELSYKRYGDILWDDKNRLWFCADIDGVFRWNARTGSVKVFKDELVLGKPSANANITGNIFRDSRGNIWFNRPGGISVCTAQNDSIINFIYGKQPANSFSYTHCFAEDKQGRVWASAGNGWVGYASADEPSKGLIQKIALSEQGTRLDEAFFKLAADREGNIWGASDKHLVKINTNDLTSETFSFRYGITEIDFFGFTVLPDGELVLGGRNNIVLAHPQDLKRNTEAPRPYLTGISIRQQPFRGSIPVFGEAPLRLKHYQNFFSFSFSAQAFSLGKEIRFRYRLNGFDDWVETADRRFANYTNVPGGKYVFQLQAANNEGIWSEHMLEIPVIITTAWWSTLWFRVIALVLVAVVSWWLYRRRIKQVKQREYIRSEFEKKLANVEMSALRAQMNPHFLFNSLNSIDSYIIRNETKKASEYLNNFARLIRLILQNSRSNYISLKDELETLELYLQMESLRFKNKFHYEIHVQDGLDTSTIDIPPMLIQPYVENAIWHGLMHQDIKTGKVKVSILEKEGKLLCIVEDNGIGREKAMEIRSKKSGGTRRSMGMIITQDRIEIINKMYDTETSVQVTDLTDEKGKPTGTKVELKIPV